MRDEKKFEFINHACIRIADDGLVCYSDPYGLTSGRNDADIILITHGHYDHYSIRDIFKVGKDSTIFVIPETVDTPDFNEESIVRVKPSQEYKVKGKDFVGTLVKAYYSYEYNEVVYIIEDRKHLLHVAKESELAEFIHE